MNYHEPHVPLFASKEYRGNSKRGLYGDMMYQMDDSIGTIMQKLKNKNIDENTIIFFISDHGAWPDVQQSYFFFIFFFPLLLNLSLK